MSGNQLLEGVFEIVREHFRNRTDRDLPVRTWRTPEELADILDVAVGTEGVGVDELLHSINAYLSECVKTQHPHFLQGLGAQRLSNHCFFMFGGAAAPKPMF